MSTGIQQTRGASPFSRGGFLAVLVVGFIAFLAMLYFIATGDTGERDTGGEAHAAADGINGYSGLTRLLKANGYTVETSRSRAGFETTDLLILTPNAFTDPEEFAEILQNREYLGPTLVILPKWQAIRPREDVVEADEERMQDDWVSLIGANAQDWTGELPSPFRLTHKLEKLEDDASTSWGGLELSGSLPTRTIAYAESGDALEPLIVDAGGHALAVQVVGEEGSEYYENAHWVMFVAEPDLMNNYGLADPARASAALALVREAGYGDTDAITIDLTLNGFGGSVNLLTLAFQPPFLAATLCLILALLIVGWRAFLRFGPTAAPSQELAFGKRRLVSNGAGLIVRARRMRLLGEPYIALIERRLAHALGIARADEETLDAALARRLPGEESFSSRAARLREAERPIDILRAAQALYELMHKTSGDSEREATQ